MSICAYTEGPSSVVVTADSKGFLKIWDQVDPETGTQKPKAWNPDDETTDFEGIREDLCEGVPEIQISKPENRK